MLINVSIELEAYYDIFLLVADLAFFILKSNVINKMMAKLRIAPISIDGLSKGLGGKLGRDICGGSAYTGQENRIRNRMRPRWQWPIILQSI